MIVIILSVFLQIFCHQYLDVLAIASHHSLGTIISYGFLNNTLNDLVINSILLVILWFWIKPKKWYHIDLLWLVCDLLGGVGLWIMYQTKLLTGNGIIGMSVGVSGLMGYLLMQYLDQLQQDIHNYRMLETIVLVLCAFDLLWLNITPSFWAHSLGVIFGCLSYLTLKIYQNKKVA